MAPSSTWMRRSSTRSRSDTGPLTVPSKLVCVSRHLRSGCAHDGVVGLVAQARAQPPLHLFDVQPFAGRVIHDLILPNAPDAEVEGVRMGEVPAAHRRGGQHRVALGELNAYPLLGPEQLEDRALLGVVGAGRIPGRGADALVPLGDQL